MSKNYEEMSDFEISCDVASIIYGVDKSGMKELIYANKKSAPVWESAIDGLKSFDINNPLDAWPIILENKIATEWHYADVWRAQCDNQHKPGSYKVFTSYCYNPLRAAMICFLKLKDSESDHA